MRGCRQSGDIEFLVAERQRLVILCGMAVADARWIPVIQRRVGNPRNVTNVHRVGFLDQVKEPLIVLIARPVLCRTAHVFHARLVNTLTMVVQIARRGSTVEHSLDKRLAHLVRPGNIVRVLVKQLMQIFVPPVLTDRPPDKRLPHAMDSVHLVNIVSLVPPVVRTVPLAQWQPQPADFHK